MTLENAKAELEKFVSLKTTMRPAFVQPLLDAKEVKHSHWVIERGETVMHCNSCGWAFEYYGGLEEEWNYCPHCGAKMEEVTEDDTVRTV